MVHLSPVLMEKVDRGLYDTWKKSFLDHEDEKPDTRTRAEAYRIHVKQTTISDEAHFWLNGYVNKQNCRIWSESNPQVYVETPLHPEKLIVWCTLWAGGILLQKR
ncbi:putative transposable element [Trichonephila clavipes]|nr:putative transposable element [Trichonephila clavipes]